MHNVQVMEGVTATDGAVSEPAALPKRQVMIIFSGATLSASRVAMTVWQERDRRGSLPALFDEVFDQLASGFSLVPRRTARRGRRSPAAT